MASLQGSKKTRSNAPTRKEKTFKDKDKPVEIRSSNITAAKGKAIPQTRNNYED